MDFLFRLFVLLLKLQMMFEFGFHKYKQLLNLFSIEIFLGEDSKSLQNALLIQTNTTNFLQIIFNQTKDMSFTIDQNLSFNNQIEIKFFEKYIYKKKF